MKIFLFLITFSLTLLSATAQDNSVSTFDSSHDFVKNIPVTDSAELTFYFKFNDTELDIDFASNLESLSKIDMVLSDSSLVSDIDTLKISATASPDGRYDYNLQLASARVLALKSMLIDYYPALRNSVIETNSYVASWAQLKSLIEDDTNIPFREKVLNILDEDLDPGAIGWKLKGVGYGASWDYISQKYAQYLRMSNITIHTIFKKNIFKLNTIEICNDNLNTDINSDELDTAVEIPKIADFDATLMPLSLEITTNLRRKNILAFKTNLLFDALSLINIEAEIPLGKRFSIAGEWIFPWWIFDNGKTTSNRSRIQMLNANFEVRYWLGNRNKRPNMTGWFIGIYAGGGLYDFEYKSFGYQGEFFIMGGLSGGYAHAINRKGTLRMEYSLGVGYMQTDYRHYESHLSSTGEWHSLYNKGGRYSWIGPTKAKVSLVWMLNKRGGRK